MSNGTGSFQDDWQNKRERYSNWQDYNDALSQGNDQPLDQDSISLMDSYLDALSGNSSIWRPYSSKQYLYNNWEQESPAHFSFEALGALPVPLDEPIKAAIHVGVDPFREWWAGDREWDPEGWLQEEYKARVARGETPYEGDFRGGTLGEVSDILDYIPGVTDEMVGEYWDEVLEGDTFAGATGRVAMDALGNYLWGAGMTTGIGMVADIGTEGKLKRAMGVKEWEDKSWLEVGAEALGVYHGFLRGMKVSSAITNKGLKLGGVGSRSLGKDIKEELVKEGFDVGSQNFGKIVRQGARDIKTAQKTVRKSTTFGALSLRSSIKNNPLDQAIFRETMEKTMMSGLKKQFPKASNTELAKIYSLVQSASMSYGRGQWQRGLALSFSRAGLNPKVSKVVSELLHEGMTLGAYETMVGVLGELGSDIFLDDDQKKQFYGDKGQEISFEFSAGENLQGMWHKFFHGLKLGGMLGSTRMLFPGGLQVVKGETGVLANVKNAVRTITNKMKPARMTDPKHMQRSLLTIYNSSGRNTKIFHKYDKTGTNLISAPNISQNILTKKKLTANDAKVLTEAYKNIRSHTGVTVAKFLRNAQKDITGSSFRMAMGSAVMNAEGFADAHKRGLYLPDDQGRVAYPVEQMIVDFIIGMAYMKNSKQELLGWKKQPKYYEKTGQIDGKGLELSHMVKFYDNLGYSKAGLDIIAAESRLDIESRLSDKFDQLAGDDADLAAIKDKLLQAAVSHEQGIDMLMNQGGSGYVELVKSHLSTLFKRLKTTEGAEKGALREEIRKIQDELYVTEILERESQLGYGGLRIRPMDNIKEALDFIHDIASSKFKGENTFTADNVVDQMRDLRHVHAKKVSKEIEDHLMSYIESQLIIFGDTPTRDKKHRLIINSSIMQLIEKGSVFGSKAPYQESMITLRDAIEKGVERGFIKYNEVARTLDPVDKGKMDNAKHSWEAYTEGMHDLVWKDSGVESWREVVPTWIDRPTNEFLDPQILSSVPIWTGIQISNRRFRNTAMYETFKIGGKGDSGADSFNRVLAEEYFKDARRLEVEIKENETPLTPEESLFLENINNTFEFLNPKQTRDVQKIDVGHFNTLVEKIRSEFGNAFDSPIDFIQFKTYMFDRSASEFINDPRAHPGLKKAIVSLMNDANPLSFKDRDVLRIYSSEVLKEVLLGDRKQVLDPKNAEDVMTREILDLYIDKVENPIKRLEGDSRVQIVRDIQPNMDVFTKEQFRNSMLEAIFQADKTSIRDITQFMNLASETVAYIDKVIENMINKSLEVDSTKEVPKEIRDALDELSYSGQRLFDIVQLLIQKGDMVGLRKLSAKYSQFYEINTAMSSDKINDTKSIRRYKEILDEYIIEALSDKDAKWRMENMQDVDTYIDEIIQDIYIANDSRAPRTKHTTINEVQYINEYNVSRQFIEMLKKKPKELLMDNNVTMSQEGLGILKYLETQDAAGRTVDILRGLSDGMIGNYTSNDYINHIIKPIIESQKPIIEAKFSGDPAKWNAFKRDTLSILQQGIAGRKVPVATVENGKIHISQIELSNWNKGYNKMNEVFGFDPGEIMYLTERGVVGNRIQSISVDTVRGLEAKFGKGMGVTIESHDLMTSNDRTFIEQMKWAITGTGEGSKMKWGVVTLDSKTVYIISEPAAKKIERAWDVISDVNEQGIHRGGELRRELEAAFRIDPNVSADQAVVLARRYLERVGDGSISFESNGRMRITDRAKAVRALLGVTRVLKTFPNDISKLADGSMADDASLSRLKYVRFDNPRTGISMNEKNVRFTMDYLNSMFPRGESNTVDKILDITNNHLFDGDRITRKRKFVFEDESDAPGVRAFFNTSDVAKRKLRESLREERPNEFPDTAEGNEKLDVYIEKIMKNFDEVAASRVNGEEYLSLPEMVSMLTMKGANPDWFVWVGGQIVGFRTVVKPIEFHSNINHETGEVTIYIGKTAYKYDPVIDAAMKVGDKYWTDSITFSSASKENYKKDSFDAEGRKMSREIDIDPETHDFINWKADLSRTIENIAESSRESGLVFLPRGDIFIKSISAEHDATITTAFTNFMSDASHEVMNTITRSSNSVNDLIYNRSQLFDNPFAYRKVAEQLQGGANERGDGFSNLVGIEAMIEAGGIPVWEYTAPQVERMMVSEYVGRRNFTTSETINGGYNVMTAGEGLSLPIRVSLESEAHLWQGRDMSYRLQKRFGGSGLPFHQYMKPLKADKGLSPGRSLFEKGSEGINLIVSLDKGFIESIRGAIEGKDVDIVKRLNSKERESLIQELENLIREGDEIVMTGDGRYLSTLNIEYMNGRASGRSVKVFQEMMKRLHKDIMDHVQENPPTTGEWSLRDLIWALDHGAERIPDMEVSTAKNNMDYYSNGGKHTIDIWDRPLLKSIHVADVNLRSPKAGINDWVITKIEKMLDKRKGPVSEMNMLDVLDPQDADFDLDKSSSFHALPGRVVADIYNWSGFNDPKENIYERVWESYETDNPGSIQKYKAMIDALELRRPGVVRQGSIASILNQMTTKVNLNNDPSSTQSIEKLGDSILRPGTGGDPHVIFRGKNELNNEFIVKIRGGADFGNSIQRMKSLIGLTIDIYKENPSIGDAQLVDKLWFDHDRGLFEIYELSRDVGKEGAMTMTKRGYDESTAKMQQLINELRNGMIEPLGQMFNIANQKQTFSDGSSRKMSMYEMVQGYSSTKWSIFKTGRDNSELQPFADQLLNFIGAGDQFVRNKVDLGKMSNHPLIKGLKAMEQGLQNNFPDRLPISHDLVGVLEGQFTTINRDKLNTAIKDIVADDKKIMQLSYQSYEREQIHRILNDLTRMNKTNDPSFEYWKNRLQVINEVVDQLNAEINFKKVQELARPNKGSLKTFVAQNMIHVYKFKQNGEFEYRQYKRGETVEWNTGEYLLNNPKRYQIGNDSISMHRRAMWNAFAREMPNLESGDLYFIEAIVRDYNEKMRDKGKIVDPNETTTHKFGDEADVQMTILMDHVDLVSKAAPSGKVDAYVKQFLYTLLTPKASNNVFDIIGYSVNENQIQTHPHLTSNKTNERLVMSFLNQARQEKASTIISSLHADGIYRDIIKKHKTALLFETDPRMQGAMFKDLSIQRENVFDYSLRDSFHELPAFLKADNVSVNEKARDILLSYINGSYFMSPADVYKWTIGLGRGKGESLINQPNITDVNSFVSQMWKGATKYKIDPQGWHFKSREVFLNETYHNLDKSRIQNDLVKEFQNKFKKIIEGC